MDSLRPSKSEREARSRLDLIVRSLLLLKGVEPSKGQIKKLTQCLRPTVSHADLMNADPAFLERADHAVMRSLGLKVPDAETGPARGEPPARTASTTLKLG